MLTISNNPGDAHVAETNFWASEYNARGLCYLSRHSKGLRLFVPTAHVSAWLPEIKTATYATLEPPARTGYVNNIDVVFNDGTSCPFSISLDKNKQLDFKVLKENTKIIIYVGNLNDYIEMPCKIELPTTQKEQYIYHVTTTTGHGRKSPRSEISPGTIEMLLPWIDDMLNGHLRGIFDTQYTCRAGVNNSKMCEFIISKTDNYFKHIDIIKFVVCRHSRKKSQAWGLIEGRGEPPEVPFCAVQLIKANIKNEDLQHLALFADFERCIAWAWISYTEDK